VRRPQLSEFHASGLNGYVLFSAGYKVLAVRQTVQLAPKAFGQHDKFLNCFNPQAIPHYCLSIPTNAFPLGVYSHRVTLENFNLPLCHSSQNAIVQLPPGFSRHRTTTG
jgi:hypothetical protein